MLKKVVRETEIWKLTVGRRNSIYIAFYQHWMNKGITVEAETNRVYVLAISYDDVVGNWNLRVKILAFAAMREYSEQRAP